MSSRELPTSRHDLSTYWGRVKHAADISDPRTLLASKKQLQSSIDVIRKYKSGELKVDVPGGIPMDQVWRAKKIVDSTIHPDTGEPVFLPFRMSCFVLSNLIVTAGMLQPGLGTVGTIGWQVTNQSLNVAINSSNANKSSPLSTADLAKSFALAVSASCSVAVGLNALVPRLTRLQPTTRLILSRLVPFAAVASAGALNVFLMRGGEIRKGIEVFVSKGRGEEGEQQSLGKSKKAALLAVGETALSRVLNATPIMVLPPLILVRLQERGFLKARPGLTVPVNLGLIFATSIFALPLALGAFPQRQSVDASSLEPEIMERAKALGVTRVEFNRGI